MNQGQVPIPGGGGGGDVGTDVPKRPEETSGSSSHNWYRLGRYSPHLLVLQPKETFKYLTVGVGCLAVAACATVTITGPSLWIVVSVSIASVLATGACFAGYFRIL